MIDGSDDDNCDNEQHPSQRTTESEEEVDAPTAIQQYDSEGGSDDDGSSNFQGSMFDNYDNGEEDFEPSTTTNNYRRKSSRNKNGT